MKAGAHFLVDGALAIEGPTDRGPKGAIVAIDGIPYVLNGSHRGGNPRVEVRTEDGHDCRHEDIIPPVPYFSLGRNDGGIVRVRVRSDADGLRGNKC